MNAGEGETLVRRYLDDRDSLSDRETLALARWLEADPSRVAELRGDLVLDELLAQKFAVDRRNFPAQVRQRVSDWLRGEQTLDTRAAELRALAAGQLQEYAKRRSSRRWVGWTIALAAVLAFAAATPLFLSAWHPTVARVEAIDGEAFVIEGEAIRDLQAGDRLRNGVYLKVNDGGRVEFVYDDGTRVAVEGGATASLSGQPFDDAKRVRLHSGELLADVAPQPVGAPMTFVTPHSEARVLGTELLLEVSQDATRLEVREGKVEFRRTLPSRGREPQSVIVKTDQSGLSARSGLALEEGLWPTLRAGLVFLHVASAAGISFDEPQTGEARTSTVASEGRAWFDRLYRLAFDGGRFAAADEDSQLIAAALQKSGSFSLETAVLAHEPTKESVSLLRLADPADPQASPAFELRLQGTKLSLALSAKPASNEPNAEATPSTLVERDLGELSPGEPMHIVVTYGEGRLHAYRDGTPALQEKIEGAGTLVVPAGAKLTFGPADSRGPSFSGTLEAIAIYDRELAAREVRRNSLELRRARSLRSDQEPLVLRLAPVDEETFAKAWEDGPAKLAEASLVFVDLPRSDAAGDHPAYVSLATIVDPQRPGERERVAELLKRGEVAGVPLREIPGLDRLPRGELPLPAAHAVTIGAGAQFFVDGIAGEESDRASAAAGE
ncbi:MAG TPA: FecR domain-containing protein [Pirellulaceae bacterium]|jgi:hypothetical protein|nr:FecR domain-containing protein [Pirellulaceae bacterium]